MKPTKNQLYKAIRTIQKAKIISERNIMELNALVETRSHLTSKENNQQLKPLKDNSNGPDQNESLSCGSGDVDKTVDTGALTNPSLDEVSRNDGRRIIMTGCPDEMEDVYDSKCE